MIRPLGFFMVGVFPFIVALFSCVVRMDLLRQSVAQLSILTVPVVVFVGLLIMVVIGVPQDFYAPDRLHAPYLYHDPAVGGELATTHDAGFRGETSFDFARGRYRQVATKADFSNAVKRLYMICNFVNVGFGVGVFSYILLVAVNPEKIGEKTCNHLVVILACSSLWFPCRVYADWYMNLTDMSWLRNYAAAQAMAVLMLVTCIVLAIKVVPGNLYQRLIVPAGAIGATTTLLAAKKPEWLSQFALGVSSFHPVFQAAIALVMISLLFFVSSIVHQ